MSSRFSPGISNEKTPSRSVTVPTSVFLMRTDTPGTGSPDGSVTLPVTFRDSGAAFGEMMMLVSLIAHVTPAPAAIWSRTELRGASLTLIEIRRFRSTPSSTVKRYRVCCSMASITISIFSFSIFSVTRTFCADALTDKKMQKYRSSMLCGRILFFI